MIKVRYNLRRLRRLRISFLHNIRQQPDNVLPEADTEHPVQNVRRTDLRVYHLPCPSPELRWVRSTLNRNFSTND
jgi:hypothetical protein